MQSSFEVRNVDRLTRCPAIDERVGADRDTVGVREEAVAVAVAHAATGLLALGAELRDAVPIGGELEDVVVLVVGDVYVPRCVGRRVAHAVERAHAVRGDRLDDRARCAEHDHLALGAVGHVDELAGRGRAHGDADRGAAARHLERLEHALPGRAVQLQDPAVAVVGDVDVAGRIDSDVTGLLVVGEGRGVGAARSRITFCSSAPHLRAARGVHRNLVVARVCNHDVAGSARGDRGRIRRHDLHARGVHCCMPGSADRGRIGSRDRRITRGRGARRQR